MTVPADHIATVRVWRWRAGESPTQIDDALVHEQPLEIRVRGRAVAVTMRTPGHDGELAAGFLLTEGVIREPGDVFAIEPCHRAPDEDGQVVNVFLTEGVAMDYERLTRHVFASSSCGVCGKATIDAVHQHFPPVDGEHFTVKASLLADLPKRMRVEQAVFQRTGGLHAAALFDAAGRLLVLREDVGRHNAVDKVIGHAFERGWLPLHRHVLLVSGRASFEIMQKALAARVAVVAAVSAPSSLAVNFAEQSGQTLAAFVREGRVNIYADRDRVELT
ncbi:MAG: formate dehydrogenase accessory sulfurtransferase FdhD [Phycisphaeraceae bacterium]